MAAQTASIVAQLPLPIRKGFLTLHVSVLPLMLPVGSIYHGGDEMVGETVGDAARNPAMTSQRITCDLVV
jgi:hypothetical protein